jgi:hypothetical protein
VNTHLFARLFNRTPVTGPSDSKRREHGGSLVLVLVVTAAGIMLVSGVLTWTSTNSDLTQRLHHHDGSVAAAGAATEKIISHIIRDFYSGGNTSVVNNLGVYRTIVPSSNDVVTSGGGLIGGIIGGLLPGDGKADWSKFEFSDAQNNPGRSYVNQVGPWTFTNIPSRYPGLNGYSASYRVVSNVRNHASRSQGASGVKQELVVASIPVFQYQIFYTPDLEINPGAAMTLNGRVHCNGTIYCQPAEPLLFQGPVTSARRLVRDKHPLDPVERTAASVTCQGGYESGVNSLHLPLGTNTSPSALHSIIEIPPASESRTSTLGRQRLYNKADLIILVSNNVAVAKSGSYNNFSVIVPWTNISERVVITGGKGKGGKGEGLGDKGKKKQIGITNIYDGVISTNVTFFNHRENKTVRCTEIDITEFLEKFSYLQTLLGRPVRTLYVADVRTPTATTQSGVRVVYGESLPATGLTIVSPNPLYLMGDYNTPLGNSNGVPAALIGDAIILLSPDWSDTNSSGGLLLRNATNMTVNAALIGGIVPTGGGYFSGGLENLPRLLEDWTGYTLTIKGSVVSLYPSTIATAPWGARPDVYKPPRRSWSFDPNFNSPAGLPPNTPEVRTIIRRGWEVVQANRVN